MFGGSTIKQGERHAVVYATGPNTFFGRSAALISGVHNVPNIQKVRLLPKPCDMHINLFLNNACQTSSSQVAEMCDLPEILSFKCVGFAQIMTKIGACCLITIFIWVVIELAVQFGGYHHHCDISGAGAYHLKHP